MRHDPTFWLLARAFGLTAYVMLTLSVLVGLMPDEPEAAGVLARLSPVTASRSSWTAPCT